MKNFRILLSVLVAFVAFIALDASAQSSQAPVRWRTFVKRTSPTEGIVTIRCLISDGFHVYGTELPQGGPKPTVIDFDGSTGITFDGPLTPSRPATESLDPLFDMTLGHWDSNVEFTRKFTIDPKAGAELKVMVKITYMCCDNQNCRPPKTETVAARVPEYKP